MYIYTQGLLQRNALMWLQLIRQPTLGLAQPSLAQPGPA